MNIKKNAAFTLIELLVVVLIVGILAAMALPEYKMAVAKARVTELLPLLDSIRKSQEVYYMANGRYRSKWEDLGLEIGGISSVRECTTSGITTTCFNFNGYTCYVLSHGGSAYCSGGGSSLPEIGINMTNGSNWKIYGDKVCIASDEWENRVCQALGGTEIRTSLQYTYYALH